MPRKPLHWRPLRALAAAAFSVQFVAAGAVADPVPLPSGVEEIPSATRDDVVRALRKVRRKYGDDAVVLETQLLINAMRNGTVGTTAVGVDGVAEYQGKRYLGFNVETGLIFDTQTRDMTTRIHMLWSTIMVPTLATLKGLQVPGDGIKVTMQYHHRPYRTQDELRATIDRPGTLEEVVFYLLTADVEELVARRLTAPTLMSRTRITVDGAERHVPSSEGDVPTAPGPE